MKEEVNKPDSQNGPDYKVHETENYITAIIGSNAPEVSESKKYKDFLEILGDARRDPNLKEQLLDALKKSDTASDFLVESISSPMYKDYRQDLLALCWEAALNMNKHLDYFIRLAAELEEPTLILEVETIIQDMDLNDKKKRDTSVELLKKSLPGKKNPLAKEILTDLIDFIQSTD